jgi:hypothetical protein
MASPKKNVLIVNGYFDHVRRPVSRPMKVPQAMAPAFLAAALSRDRCNVRLYSELSHGPLTSESLLAWPDLLVLTGLTTAFDRLLHLTAYARTKNPGVVVVAGGAAIRALPKLAARFFDYVCLGDVEELRSVVADCLGAEYVSEEMTPRYDLARSILPVGYVETSRNCNFHCTFCSLTGERRTYQPYSPDVIRQQVHALGRQGTVVVIDNNFYGNDRRQFLSRLDAIHDLFHRGYFKRWGALVTGDFFAKRENLERARDAGCKQLFCGIESFDRHWLSSVEKEHNLARDPVALIRETLDHDVLFAYGLILDVYRRSLKDIREELEFVTGTPEISLPAFVGVPIPILGTPLFRSYARAGLLLPSVKLRDMDATNLVARTRDPLEEVAQFVKEMMSLRGYRKRLLRHVAGFVRRYHRKLSPYPLAVAVGHALNLSAEGLGTGAVGSGRGNTRRTHVSTTEPLDEVYRPMFALPSRYESHFRPTMVTDARGELTADIAE